MYQIDPLSFKQAKKLGVEITPSTRKGKKIDVFLDKKKIASIGAEGYNDYYYYLRVEKTYAEERRKLYKIRHEKDIDKLNGYLAWVLLWNGDI
jgi:hypothetical protein